MDNEQEKLLRQIKIENETISISEEDMRRANGEPTHLGNIELDSNGNEVINLDEFEPLVIDFLDEEIDIKLDDDLSADIVIELDEIYESLESIVPTIETLAGIEGLEKTIEMLRKLIRKLIINGDTDRSVIHRLEETLNNLERLVQTRKVQIETVGNQAIVPGGTNRDIEKIARVDAKICNEYIKSFPDNYISSQALVQGHHKQENLVTTQTCVIASLMNCLISVGFNLRGMSEADFVKEYHIDDKDVFSSQGTMVNQIFSLLSAGSRTRNEINQVAQIYLGSDIFQLVSGLLAGGSVFWARHSGSGVGHAYAITGLCKRDGGVFFVVNDPMKNSAEYVSILDESFLKNILADNQFKFVFMPNQVYDHDLRDRL